MPTRTLRILNMYLLFSRNVTKLRLYLLIGQLWIFIFKGHVFIHARCQSNVMYLYFTTGVVLRSVYCVIMFMKLELSNQNICHCNVWVGLKRTIHTHVRAWLKPRRFRCMMSVTLLRYTPYTCKVSQLYIM